jgi:hypothetical protein
MASVSILPEGESPADELRQGCRKGAVILDCMAERGGFEPPSGYYPEHAFQACDLNHSSTSPRAAHHTGSACARQIGMICYATPRPD